MSNSDEKVKSSLDIFNIRQATPTDKFERLQLLSQQLQMFFQNNSDIPYFKHTKYISVWLANISKLDDLGARDKLFGTMQMNALSKIVRMFRNYIYDQSHLLCFEQQRQDICQQLYKMIINIDLKPLEDPTLINAFAECRNIYENSEARTQERIVLCMKSWVQLYDVLEGKIQTMIDLLQHLMGTSWMLQRNTILNKAKGLFGGHMEESLVIAESSQKENFYFLRDMANVLFDTNTIVQQDIVSLNDTIQTLDFKFQQQINPIGPFMDNLARKFDQLNDTVQQLPRDTQRMVENLMDSSLKTLNDKLREVRDTQLPEILQNITDIKIRAQNQSINQDQMLASINLQLQKLSVNERKIAEDVVNLRTEEIQNIVQNMMNEQMKLLLTDISQYKQYVEQNIEQNKEFNNTISPQLRSIQARMDRLPEDIRQQVEQFFQQSVSEMQSNLQRMQNNQTTSISEITSEILAIKQSVLDYNSSVSERFAQFDRSTFQIISDLQEKFNTKLQDVQQAQQELRNQIDQQSAPPEIKQIISDIDDNKSIILQQQSGDIQDLMRNFKDMETKLGKLQISLDTQNQQQRSEIVRYQRMQAVYLFLIFILGYAVLDLYKEINMLQGNFTQSKYTG